MRRTPEFIEHDPAPHETTATNAAIDKFSTLDLEERTQRTLVQIADPPNKVKIKTRGDATEQESAVHADRKDILTENLTTTRTIPVSHRAQKLFSILFNNSAEGNLPGEVPWNEFLHALSSAGFAVEKNHGSAWLFTPPPVDGWHPIIFHEPHPSSKIPIQVALRHGRRLERAYGWTAQTFVRA